MVTLEVVFKQMDFSHKSMRMSQKTMALVWLVVEPYPSEKSWSESQMG